MIAELSLDNDLAIVGTPSGDKWYAGGWILSPKNFHHLRHYVSVLPALYQSDDELSDAISKLQQDRGWHALATFLTQSRIVVIVSGAITVGGFTDIRQLQWQHYVYRHEQLHQTNHDEPFALWDGNRGRPSKGKPWSPDVESRYQNADDQLLTSLALRQAFYYGYLKEYLKKPIEDPYDVDAFLVGYSGNVMPVEIKEKSRTPKKEEFGVDAGRILMLLRLCIATDSNALYTIREVDETHERNLRGWQYITLADLIMKCRWNLQGGGAGMGGGATQTIMMPCELFQPLTTAQFSESWLAENGSLQTSVRVAAEVLNLEFMSIYGDKFS
jgi:hypothetical protein